MSEPTSTGTAGRTGAVLHAPLTRNARGYAKQTVPRLGMACAIPSRDTTGGIPFSEVGEEAVGSWLCVGAFAGRVDGREVGAIGTCALTFAGERMLAILDADDEVRRMFGIGGDPQEKQTVWIAAPRGGVEVTTEGQRGLFSKRPALIHIATEDWDLHLREVRALSRACTPETAFKHNSSGGPGENSLVAALRG
jgi:hypothetical protein